MYNVSDFKIKEQCCTDFSIFYIFHTFRLLIRKIAAFSLTLEKYIEYILHLYLPRVTRYLPSYVKFSYSLSNKPEFQSGK
ncbi:hypothetical protein PUN28_016410 [Cardiocondyla obscurior]|uniref:Uncharacterized protein n=1 Tax=Cardiocondyla obscurior TaxID=286306 RepID=A0AAW2EQW7_9HYME